MIEGEEVKIPDTNGKGRSHTCVKCDNCSKLFYKPTRFLKRGTIHFCGKVCKGAGKTAKGITEVVCSQCGITFNKRVSNLKGSKSGLYFCSRACKDSGQSLEFGLKEIWPAHYGTSETGYSSNYRAKVTKHRGIDSCDTCGYDEHPEVLQVHHKDRDRSNNTLENLQVLCPNCHMWEHCSNRDGLYNNLR